MVRSLRAYYVMAVSPTRIGYSAIEAQEREWIIMQIESNHY